MNDRASLHEVERAAAPHRAPRREQPAPHRGRLFRKYLALILTLVCGALVVSGAITVFFAYGENKSALAELEHEKAIAAASRIEQYIAGIDRQLRFVSTPQLDPATSEQRRIEFLRVLRQAPEVTEVAYVDARGQERTVVSRLRMDSSDSMKDRSREPAFAGAKPGRSWFGTVYFEKGTEPYMTIAQRTAADGGVTLAEVNLKFIWDVVSRIKIGGKGKAYVVDGNGFLIADPDIGLVLRKTQMGDLPHVRKAIDGWPANELAMESTDRSGKRTFVSFAPIESLGWKVFAEQPMSEVNAGLYAPIQRTGLLLVAGLVISALVAFMLARRMARPIATLSEGAQKIGAGELSQTIVVRTGDELEGLADQFNRMSGQLRESYASLERKVDERTHELKQALEQQTAISEILRTISSSPTDVQPVLQAVAERAARLCDAPIAQVVLVERNDTFRPVAVYGISHDPRSGYDDPHAMLGQSMPLQRTYLVGRAIVDRTTLHYSDIVPLLDSEFPDARTLQKRFGFRALMAVPLMREDAAYGAVLIWRREARAFAPEHVTLLQTFAQQAAIAIDNVRLFNETREALEQQTAISEILRTISSSPTNVQPVLDKVAERALRLCEAAEAVIVLVERGALRFAAGFGTTPTPPLNEVIPLDRGLVSGRAVIDGVPVHLEDLAAASEEEFPRGLEMQRRLGHRAILAVPLMREGRAIGALTLWRMEARSFSDAQVTLIRTFADQAAIAIENVRLFNETKEALEQQTAISEILRTISSSPTDVQPVLDAIAERAARLCDAASASMYLIDGGSLRHLASRGPWPDQVSHVATLPIDRDTVTGCAVLERRTIQLEDLMRHATDYPLSHDIARRLGHRAVVVTPLLREGQPFGAILLRRNEVRPFSERDIALLRTFGDQAAIALENVRLFNETNEALEQQRASGEVLAAISSSIADTAPVFDKIVQSCERLFAGKLVQMNLVGDDALVRLGSYHGPGRESIEHIFPFPVDNSSATGLAILRRSVVHFPDVDHGEDVPSRAREGWQALGIKAAIAAPMLWEGKGIGAILVGRDHAGTFNDKDIALVKTFADQAVIAIQNARLFNETKEALEQQRASGDVLAAISSSIADTQPVFDRILASCERLFAGHAVGINLVGDDGLVHLGVYHGPGREQLERLLEGGTGTGSAIRERRIIHFADVEHEPSLSQKTRAACAAIGVTAVVFAPMLWEGRGIGTIFVGREQAGRFSDKEIALLKTFADQAVIAIQNARLFREIEEKSRQLEIANKHKSDFLASMSHELRTPLNAIIGFSEVLLERLFGEVNDKQEDYLKDIHSSGRHLLALINDILDLSKVEAGRMELDLGEFDLPSAIGAAMSLVRERATQHRIALGVDVDPRLGPWTADERKVKQILLNLLSNAVKFTPDGGRVDVSAKLADDHVKVSVRDTGIGIAAHDQAAVFEEFRQVGGDYARKQEGTGLGLALTRRFIELHGGRISLESSPGKGSTFTFTLPNRS